MKNGPYFFRYAVNDRCRDKVNRIIASKGELQMAGELLMSAGKDELEKAVSGSRRMYQTDLMSNLATAEDRGRSEGRRDAVVEMAGKMLAYGRPVEEISLFTGLTGEEIQTLRSRNA